MGFLHTVLIFYVLCIPLCKTKVLVFLYEHFMDLRVGPGVCGGNSTEREHKAVGEQYSMGVS